MKSDHPSEAMLAASICQQADQATEDAVAAHLTQCPQCRIRLDAMAVGDDAGQEIFEVLRRESDAAKSSGTIDQVRRLEHESIVDFAVAFLEPSTRSDALGRLGEFEILSVIGHGGMGIVLKGFQEELNRPVAVKVMSPHLATVAVARKRFLREAQATAAVVHPNVMPILSVSESSSLPFLVMPFVACHSLQQRLDADGAMPLVDTLRIAVQVAHGLAAAHAQGLVHRDVKPANILLERSVDRAMLTDFGLARAADDVTVTRSGVIAGTPQYMSPEQARGSAIDARSDLFSFGSVIHAMAIGRPPFRAETSYGILRKITDDDVQPMRDQSADVPQWLDRLVQRLLSKDPADRPQSAAELAETLETCLAHVQQPTLNRLPDSLVLPRKPRPMNRNTVVILAATLAIAISLLSMWFRMPTRNVLPAPQPSFVTMPTVPVPIVPVPTVRPMEPEPSIDQQIQSLQNEIDQMQSQLDS
ncbi:Serine/threonine-protein kinase PknB [Rubripirellula lacrimiformis]|uniref:non-specific serine/threonine protein kinase n=1 Tax=Rubripirellula lacrimiformis TaxID=1930273 RepID=A0A517N6K7_9BACT|nr:serine/threonine-protein kinase [Rubripirellula lacrimiformis]QDT02750.1 Serine/threonine-protein kinase PknB [Rubripirellula lacrimiformis]